MKKIFVFIMLVSVNNLVISQPKVSSSKAVSETILAPNSEPVILVSTSYGDIKLKLYKETTLHRDNFFKLVESGQYNESTFHRVIQNFMIQGGGKNKGMEEMGSQFQGEIYPLFYHKRGVLSAARTGDQINPSRKSSGSQFYIVQGRVYGEAELKAMEAQKGIKFTPQQIKDYTTIGGTPHLDGGYTVFGEVLEGMDVVDKIAACPKSATQNEAPDPEITMIMRILSY